MWSSRSVLSVAASVAFAGESGAKERCLSSNSATDLQYGHWKNRSIPSSRTLRALQRVTLDEVETPVDAASPASGLLSTLARGGTAKRGAPHRSGTTLQRRSRPRAALEARPSDAHVPARPLRASSVEPIPPCLRQETRRHRLRAPSLDKCSPRRSRAAKSPPPSPGLCRRRVGFLRLASTRFRWERLGPPRPPGLVTPVPGRSGAPVDFCNHHGSPARPRIDRPPRTTLRSCLLAGCGQPCCWEHQRARPAERSQSQGPPRTRTSPPAPPHAIARWRALPRPDRLGHLLSRVRACAGRRAERR